MLPIVKLYSDLVLLYNKVHTYHIRTVRMNEAKLIHGFLGSMYLSLADLYDKVGEDILQKYYKKDVPNMDTIHEISTITDVQDNIDAQDILSDLDLDCDILVGEIEGFAQNAKNLLIQNILIDVEDAFTGFCAEIEQLKCKEESDETPEEEKTEEETEKEDYSPYISEGKVTSYTNMPKFPKK